MNYDGVNSIVCDAEENDWLDVSYSERKYVEQPAAKQRKFKFGLPKIKINKKFAVIAGVAVLCVALMVRRRYDYYVQSTYRDIRQGGRQHFRQRFNRQI